MMTTNTLNLILAEFKPIGEVVHAIKLENKGSNRSIGRGERCF